MSTTKKEVWLRGSVQGIPALLQPVAHALLQAGEELDIIIADFPDVLLWMRPAGLASPAFHLQHLTGVLNRMLTYARGEALTREQFAKLIAESKETNVNADELRQLFHAEVEKALVQMGADNEAGLTETRYVGREQVPSTVIGLYVHAAEHTMRHIGQLLVTVRVLKDQYGF